MIKTFEQYNEFDPYGEEDWGDFPDIAYRVYKDRWNKFVEYCHEHNIRWCNGDEMKISDYDYHVNSYDECIIIFIKNKEISFSSYSSLEKYFDMFSEDTKKLIKNMVDFE